LTKMMINYLGTQLFFEEVLANLEFEEYKGISLRGSEPSNNE